MATAFPSDSNPVLSETLQIQDVVKCIICKGSKSSPLVQLNCFHVSHLSCVERFMKNTQPGSNFNCSECNMATTIPSNGPEGLPHEILHCKMKEIAKIFSNTSPRCNICKEVDEDNESTNFCITCKMHLCPSDTKRHKPLPGHVIVTNEEIQTEIYLPRALTSKKALCATHSTDDSLKILELYCQDCRIPVCQLCCVTDHKQHTTVAMQNATQKFKEELKNKATCILSLKKNSEFVMNKLVMLRNDIENVKKCQIEKCKLWGEEIKKAVDNAINEAIQKIEEMSGIQENEIMKVSEEKDYQGKQFQSAKDYMEVFMKFASDSDILQQYETFLKNLNDLLQQDTQVHITTKMLQVETKNVQEVEVSFEEILKLKPLERNHRFENLRLSGCELKSKWKTGREFMGVAVYGEDIIAVGGKRIHVYGMNGQDKGQIKCEGLVHAWDIDVMDEELFISDYMSQVNRREIIIIDRNGKFKRKVSFPPLDNDLFVGIGVNQLGLAVDHINGDIYTSHCTGNTIFKCPKGHNEASPFIDSKSDSDWPQYLCVTPQHEVIASLYFSNTVCKFNSKGTLIWRYGGEGKGEGQFNRPQGVCVDPQGNIYVCDHRNHRIHHLSPEGEFMSFIDIGEEILCPRAITFNNNRIIITTDTGKMFVIKCKYI